MAIFIFPPFGFIFFVIVFYIGLIMFMQSDAPERDLKTPQVQVIEEIEEDLEANQRRKITLHQIKILIKKRIQSRWMSWFSVVILALMTVGGLVVLFIFPPFGIIFLTIVFYMSPTVFKQLDAFEQDLKTPQVDMVEGIVHLVQRSTRTTNLRNTSQTKTSISYSVQIGDRKFMVNEKVFLTFKNGDPYAIYFTPFAKTILSVDWLRDDDVH